MVEIVELRPKAGPVVYLATPCYGCYMSVMYLTSMMNLQQALLRNGIMCIMDFIGNESLIERARNIIVARFLQSEATHLLFVDADIGFNPQSVLRLIASDKDVATGIYSKKSFDWDVVKKKLESNSAEPVHQMGLDFNVNIKNQSAQVQDGFFPVLDSATGFMLIKRHVLQKMVDVYKAELQCVNDIPKQEIKEYVAIFACMIDPETRRFLSEDYSFVRRYQAIGGEIHADLTAPLAHYGVHIFSGNMRNRM